MGKSHFKKAILSLQARIEEHISTELETLTDDDI
jgi:hypothetical protein